MQGPKRGGRAESREVVCGEPEELWVTSLAIRNAPGGLQEGDLEGVMGTEANHRDKTRKQIKRKLKPPLAEFTLRGFLRGKHRNRTTALMSRQRKARPWTSSSLWQPLGCWSSAGTFYFFCVSPFTSQVIPPMASTSILC